MKPESHNLTTSRANSRRDFLRQSCLLGTALLVPAWARQDDKAKACEIDTYVKELFGKLSDETKKGVCRPLDHESRFLVSANWNVSTVKVESLPEDQQELVSKILQNALTEEGWDRMSKQMESDANGLGPYTFAFFGTPADSDFEFLLTGRHATFRCNGNQKDGFVFGGPLVYGHQPKGFTEKPDHPDNVYWYQGVQANAVFKSLDAELQKLAVVDRSPKEEDINLADEGEPGRSYQGLKLEKMNDAQRCEVKKLLDELMKNYHPRNQTELQSILDANGGMNELHLAFYENTNEGSSCDLGKDKIWDCWRIEGPGFCWHYRGAPHVHGWVNIANKSNKQRPVSLAKEQS